MWFIIGWGVLLTWMGVHPMKQDRSQFDLLRCYAKYQTTYWDGPDGTRSTPSQYRSQIYCWPKNGCWLASNGDAICWRVVKLKF